MSALKSLKVGAGLLAVALAASACGGVASNSAAGSTITIRTANVLPPDTAQSAMIDWFVAELEDRTDGEVHAEVSYGGALVSGSDTLPALQQGRAEAGFVVAAALTEVEPDLEKSIANAGPLLEDVTAEVISRILP